MMNANFIPPENLIEKFHEKEFTCFICFGIVIKPRILNCCEYLVCLGCLNKIIVYKNTNCPMCKSPISFSQPNKFIMRLFENLRFKCLSESEGCKKILDYKKFFYHFMFECENKKMILHWMEYCNNCEEVFYNNEKHFCQNDRLEFNEPQLHNHILKFTSNRSYGKMGWYCDFCEIKKGFFVFSYHCDLCKIDACSDCMNHVRNKITCYTLCLHTYFIVKLPEWNCCVCNLKKRKCYAWSCLSCNKNLCINCYFN